MLYWYTQLVTDAPNGVESALNALLDMAQKDIANVPVLLAIATCFIKLGQIPKARNQLKRIQVRPWLSSAWHL